MVTTTTIKRIEVNATTKGVKEAASELQQLKGAEQGVVVASDQLTKSQISVKNSLEQLSRRYDAAHRGAAQLASAERVLAQARAQGLISQARQAELLGLVAARYQTASTAARGYAGTLATIRGFAGGILGGITFGAILGLPVAINAAIGSVGDLADAAQRAGVSAEGLQVLRTALQQNGGAAEDADAALKTFSVRVGQLANTGAGPAARAIEALGISIRDVGGNLKSNEQLFREVIDRLAGVDNASQRAALSSELFGRSAGPNMAGVVAIGTKALDEQEQKMRDLGTLMSNDMVAAGDRLDDRFAEWAQRWQTGFAKAVVFLSDKLWGLAESMRAVSDMEDMATLNTQLEGVRRQLDAINSGASHGPGIPGLRGLFGMESVEEEISARRLALHRRENEILNRIGELNQRRLSMRTEGTGTDLEEPPGLSPLGAPAKLPNYPISLVPQIKQNTVAMSDFNEVLRESSTIAKGFLSDFRTGLQEGVGFWQSLGNAGVSALTRISDKLFDMASDKLISSLLGTFLGGLAGGGGGYATGLSGGMGVFMGGLYASGGPILGPGTGRSDSILARVSNGEYIVNSTAASHNRNLLDAINFGRIPAFAGGGAAIWPTGGIADNVDDPPAQLESGTFPNRDVLTRAKCFAEIDVKFS